MNGIFTNKAGKHNESMNNDYLLCVPFNISLTLCMYAAA